MANGSAVKAHPLGASAGAGVEVSDLPLVPERFRFSDENPLTGMTYAQSRFEDLPPWVQHVVEDVLEVSERRWNKLLGEGEVHTVAGPMRWHSLKRVLAAVRRRGSAQCPSGKLCGDCWGTGASHDYDGAMTGKVGAVHVCSCMIDCYRHRKGNPSFGDVVRGYGFVSDGQGGWR